MKARTAAMVSKSSGSAIASVSVDSASATGRRGTGAGSAARAFDFGRGGRRAVDGHQRHAQLFGERGQHVALGDEAHVDQDLAQLVAALALQFERAVEILRFDQLALDQDFAQAHGRAGQAHRRQDPVRTRRCRRTWVMWNGGSHYSISVLTSPNWADFLSALITICAGSPVVSSSGR